MVVVRVVLSLKVVLSISVVAVAAVVAICALVASAVEFVNAAIVAVLSAPMFAPLVLSMPDAAAIHFR